MSSQDHGSCACMALGWFTLRNTALGRVVPQVLRNRSLQNSLRCMLHFMISSASNTVHDIELKASGDVKRHIQAAFLLDLLPVNICLLDDTFD